MDTSVWISFLIVSMLAAFSPGPAIILTVTNSINFGSHKALWTVLGNSIGLLFVSTFIMLGLGIVLKTSATIFFVFKLIGALYLIYLGIKYLNKKQANFIISSKPTTTPSPNNLQLFLQGLLIAVTNPKAIIFFLGFFPQFINKKQDLLIQFFILTLTFSFCAIVAHIIYLLLLSRIRIWLSDLKRVRWFNRIIGGIFIFLGLGVFCLKRT